MNNFCYYRATAYIYPRDKDGNVISQTPIETFIANGCVRDDDEIYGAIMRQNPDFQKCDKVEFVTWTNYPTKVNKM